MRSSGTVRAGRRPVPPVYSITDAPDGRRGSALAGRQYRYLASMGIRTACFVGAVAASGWARWTLLVAAILLPYISVVLANAGWERAASMPIAVLRRRSAAPRD